jgi:hypothetical protein
MDEGDMVVGLMGVSASVGAPAACTFVTGRIRIRISSNDARDHLVGVSDLCMAASIAWVVAEGK